MDNLRRIVLVFSIALFVCLAVAGIVLALSNIEKKSQDYIHLNPSSSPYAGETIDPNSTPSPEIEEDDGFLLIFEGNENYENVFSIVNADKNTSKITITFILSDFKISLKNDWNEFEVKTINQLYSKGVNCLLESLSAQFDLKLSKYIITDLEGYGAFINYFTSRDQGVAFDVPCYLSFYYKDKKVVFTPGAQYLGGLQAERLLSFMKTEDNVYPESLIKYYDGSELARLVVFSSFTKAFVSQKLTNGIDE